MLQRLDLALRQQRFQLQRQAGAGQHLAHADGKRLRQPHAAMLRIGGKPDPAAFGNGAIAAIEARRSPHPPPFQPRRGKISGPVEGGDLVVAQPRRPFKNGIHHFGRGRGKAFGRGDRGEIDHAVQNEALVGKRGMGHGGFLARAAALPAQGRPDMRRLVMTATAATPTLRQMERTETLPASDAGIARAAELLREGRLVAFPTETVYGLGGDARNDQAVARIFDAKGRPRFNPLIVHLPDLAAAEGYARFDDRALELARRFWPGPLTLVLPLRAQAGLSPLVTAGLETVALRVPAHPLARALLAAFGGPVAAPSANPSGRVSPTRAAHVLAGLAGRIAAVVDGGPCAVGVESTILSLDGPPRLLRPGGVPAEVLEAALGVPLTHGPVEAGQRPSAPGQLASHYAPAAAVRLNARGAETGEILVGFGPVHGDFTLSASGDPVEAAANLFHILREADRLAGPGGRIAFAPIPDEGLGRAINDRLRRAAAPRG